MGMALAPRSSLSLRSLLLFMSHRKPHRSSFFSSAAAVQPAAPGTGPPAAPAVQPPAAPADEPSAHTLEDPKHPAPGGSCSTLQPVTCEPSPEAYTDDKACEDSDLPRPAGSSHDMPPRPPIGTLDPF
ncbi:hypothetical protein D1007_13511 [Hordeum vulgare]|nr:hypothetical protein D1007_13511 [Hordeum vulgare]